MTIEVKLGDITSIQCDAIINPANSYGYMGGGVAGAIKRKGGTEIEKEAISKAPIKVGNAISTTAGNLPNRYVIHAPTMERPAMRIGIENVEKATYAAFNLGLKLNVKSIAIPGMGTGVGQVSEIDSAKVIVKIAKEFENKFEKIILVDYNKSMIDAFNRNIKD